MRRWLSVGLALLAVIALLGVMWLLKQEPQAQEPVAPAPTVQPMKALVDKQDTYPTQLTLTQGDVSATYVHDHAANTYAAKDYDARLAFDQSALTQLFASATRLVSRKTIDVSPQDLALYGLDAPLGSVQAQYADGSAHTVWIGKQSPLGDGYFGMIDDDPSVYLLLSYDVDSFLKQLYDYRSYSLLHPMDEDSENHSLTVRELSIDRGNNDTIRFLRGADQPGGMVPPIQIVEPVTVTGDEFAFHQNVISPLHSLGKARLVLVEDMPTALDRYGLDTPRTLYVRDDGGETRLLIGKEEDGRTYLMREGVPAVLSVKSSALAFLNVDYSTVMDRLVWLVNIADVQSLTIQQPDHTVVLAIENGQTFALNGKAVDPELGRAVYRNAISFLFEGRAEQSAMDSTALCTLILRLKDGTQTSLSLYALNERHLEIARDGVSTGFYCNKSGLQNVLDALSNIE